jgi:hypothetical protein
MLFDLVSKLKVTQAIIPAARTATFATGDIIDLQGYESVMFVVHAGAVTTADSSNFVTFTIVAGDADDLTGGATVSGDDLLGSNPVINATTDADEVIGKVGYRGTKRYARLVATETGATDALYGAVAILGNARTEPQA